LVSLPRIKTRYFDENHQMAFWRTQFPVRLAYATTINKSQGQTLKKVGLYLERPVFSHGQLYIALSRVKWKEDIKIFCDPTIDAHTGKTTTTTAHNVGNIITQNRTRIRNIIWGEIFEQPTRVAATPQ